MSLNPHYELVSEDDYLKNEKVSEIRHEYIDGCLYAMAGASDNHNKVSGNIFLELKSALKKKGSACVVYTGDMRLKQVSKYYYPDVMVVCSADNKDKYNKTSPVILVEVLSDSTRRKDLTTKRFYYQNIPSLKEYVLIEQDKAEVQVCRKKDHWYSCYYYLGEEITFESIGVTVSVEDIYYQVEIADVLTYLQEKQTAAGEKS
jgi:Uma2 family endonuclease